MMRGLREAERRGGSTFFERERGVKEFHTVHIDLAFVVVMLQSPDLPSVLEIYSV